MSIHDVNEWTDDGTTPPSMSPQADIREPEQGPPAVGSDPADTTQLQRERDDLHERLLRKTAEFDNYRKRIDRERRELAEWAAADLLTDLLSVVDDLDRAVGTPAPPEADAYRAGVELILRRLVDIVRKRGATPLESLGSDFDPHLHQAVSYEEAPGAREGEVIEELSKGYRLGERLLRPAMVKVAKAS